ncbi:MAG: hypothetical protein ACOY5F_02075 [Pseudomonadota bacterium]
MYRRFLSVLLVLVIAAAGYQPALGMTGANASVMEMAADADCHEMQKDDCCGETEKGKRLCKWNDACAARCHVNAGLEAALYTPAVCGGAVAAPVFHAWAAVKSARAGPLFRPPII